MRNLHTAAFTLLFSNLISFSCSKPSTQGLVAPISPTVINAAISANQTYQLNVANPGTVNIEKQASHYKISATSTDEKNGSLIYQYLPSKDFTGQDEVILSNKILVTSYDNRGGCSSSYANDHTVSTSYNTTYTTIKITISK
ncbi:MAG: hypothetical protein ABI683_11700 [Ginsengibacter sp.]